MITIEFLVTSLIVVLVPGPGVVLTVSTGILHGRRASVFTALGCTAGILPHLLATVLGLAAILHASAVAFHALKLAGVAYLFYLAYATWRDKTAFAVDKGPTATGATSLVVRAFLINILNPKLTIFFLAFLPLFVDPGAPSPVVATFHAERRLHGDDVRRLCRLRFCRSRFPQGRHRLASRPVVAAAQFRRGIRRPRGPTRFLGAMSVGLVESSFETGDPKNG